jgi:hypothetical protein
MGIQVWWVGREIAGSEATYGASKLVGGPTVRRHFGGFSHLAVPGWWLEKIKSHIHSPIGTLFGKWPKKWHGQSLEATFGAF